MLLQGFRRAQARVLFSALDSIASASPKSAHRVRTLSTRRSQIKPEAERRKDDSIKIYEQVLHPDTKQLYVERSEGDEDVEQLRLLESRISELENMKEDDATFISKLSLDQKASLIQFAKIVERAERDKARAAQARAEKLPGHEGNGPALLKIPVLRKQRPFLDNLNRYLDEAQGPNATVKTAKELWRWYNRSKQNLPPFLFLVPQPIWHVLWSSFASAFSSSSDRSSYLKTLAEDIVAAGHELTPLQKIGYIEALHSVGEHRRAVEIWGNEVVAVGMDKKEFRAFWTLGVRMFAEQEDPERAEKTAHMLFGSKGANDPRILLPIIKAWVAKGDTKAYNKAWRLYLQVKEQLGTEMKMEDYDVISTAFLKSGKRDLGLAVFKDMMLTGDTETPDSLALYKKTMDLVGGIQSLSVDAKDADMISTELMTVLPRKFQNKIFYGSWMKKLIGMGDVDAALAVAELMWERRIQPSPKYLNGIIGAWFRSDNPASWQKAEDIARSMIEERLRFVSNRRKRTESYLTSTSTQGFSKYPRASAETFCVLLDFYASQGRHKDAEDLRNNLRQCEYKATPEFMNHFLFSAARSAGIGEVWERYKEFTSTTGEWATKPDMLTFQCLWDCMALKLSRSSSAIDGEFPVNCRELLAEFMRWTQTHQQTTQSRPIPSITRKMYNDIVRCFILGSSEDYAGCIAILNAMPKLFGLYPDDTTTRFILLKVAQAEDEEEEALRVSKQPASRLTHRQRLQGISSRRERRAKLQEASQAILEIEASRFAFLESQGIDVETMSDEDKGKEKVLVLSEFLRTILGQILGEPVLVEREVSKATWDMDLPPLEVPMADR